MPIAIPEASRSGTSLFIFENGIFCFVMSKNIPISTEARTALYSASSPDETGIFLTNGARVPNIAIDSISLSRALKNLFTNDPHVF